VASFAGTTDYAATSTQATFAITAPGPADPGFEQIVVGNGKFQYGPSGDAWTFSGTSGISGNHSGFTFYNPVAPEGSQVAFLQNFGAIRQTTSSWATGAYVLSFQAAQRNTGPTTQQDFNVLVDGTIVGTFKPSGTSYRSYSTAAFNVSSGLHTITFQGLDSSGNDDTAMLDQIAFTMVSGPTVADPGFEALQVGTNNFQYRPADTPWSFTGSAGIAANNSGFTSANPPAPQGSQVGFLQGTGSFSQTDAGWTPGSHTITFQAAQRKNINVNGEDFEILINGTVVATIKPSGTTYQTYTAPFSFSGGVITITFQGLDSAGGDNTALIDNLSVSDNPSVS
jgi:hypothetical protein